MSNGEQPQESPIPTDDYDQHDTTQLLADIAEKQLLNITEFLDKSGQEINRRKKLKNAFIIAISSLCIIAIIAFIWAFTERGEALKNKLLIEITSKSNQIATKAYMSLDKDPTLAFRLAEQAYKIYPTPLAKQVIMAAYGEMPFYRKLEGHTESCRPAKYSPDGMYIATGSLDDEVRLWTNQGKLLHILKGHISGQPLNQNAINFSPDSKYLISASSDSTARLWDLQGNCLAIMKHDGPVSSACFSPLRPVSDDSLAFSGKGSSNTYASRPYLILTASSDKTARLWHFNPSARPIGRNDRTGVIPNGRKESPHLTLKPSKTLKGHTKGLRLAKFSPDGKYILTASGDKTARIWDLEGNIFHVLRKHLFSIYTASISNNGKIIFTGDNKGNGILWDSNGDIIASLNEKVTWISTSDISSNDSLILTGSSDGLVCLWDLKGKLLKKYNKHTSVVWSVKFSPQHNNNQLKILTASDDGTTRLWDLNGTELMVLKGHTSQVLSANFSPDGKYVVTASGDNTARIWNIQPKENPVLKGHTAYVMDANFSPNGEYIITAGLDYTARLWELSGKEKQQIKGHTHYATGFARFSEDGNYILTSSGDQTVRLWDYDGNELSLFKYHSWGNSIETKIIKDKHFLFTNSNDTIILWDTTNQKLQIFEKAYHSKFSSHGENLLIMSIDSSFSIYQYTAIDTIPYKKFYQIKITGTAFTTVEFSPNNRWFITTTEDSTVRLWKFEDVKNLPEDSIKPLCEYKHPVIVSQPLFSPDSKLFLTVGNDNIVRLFDLNCNVIAEMKGHSDAINDINFSPDGKYIVTGSNDNTVRIWNLEGNELQLFPSHKAAVTKVQFSPDGSYILSASNDHTARLMPVSVEDVLHKINVEKVRGTVFQLSEDDKQVYGIVD